MCACPENFILTENQRNCTNNCTSSQFECKQTLKCIPSWWVCDGQNDCSPSDHSDEPDTWQGKNKQTILINFELSLPFNEINDLCNLVVHLSTVHRASINAAVENAYILQVCVTPRMTAKMEVMKRTATSILVLELNLNVKEMVQLNLSAFHKINVATEKQTAPLVRMK